MLENARRQLFLVLLSIVAGLVCTFTLSIPLGHDLKGGTQLRYEVPADVLTELIRKEGSGVTVQAIMTQTMAVIAERIDPAGVLDPTIVPSGDTGILIELPWFKDPQALRDVKARIANLGKLEMRMVADDDFVKETVRFQMQQEVQRLTTWLQNPENKAAIREDFRNIRRFNEDPIAGPMQIGNLAWFPRQIRPSENPDAWEAPWHQLPAYSKAMVKGYDDADWNGGLLTDAMKQKEPKDRYLVEFIALNMAETCFTGADLDPSGVGAGPGRNGRLGVNYKIVDGKSGDYADWSEKYIGKCSAIVLNDVVRSAPTFQSKIPGRGIIEGDFTNEEVNELVKVLRTGSLRIEPELVSSDSIGPKLGKDAIERGAGSLIAGTVLVFAFMLFYYRRAGTIACVTLVLNVFLLWSAMLFMQATITLPGLGGIVLTMGMAVDANVLIYERIREELAKGKDLLRSVRAGFERAMSAILDSNITTFLVGIVLYNVGVGPVRGFAVTLMVGIVTTVFTQFFVTRLLFHYALEKNWLVNYKPRSLFADLNVDFVRLIKPCFIGSGVLIAAGLVYAAFVPNEVKFGIDFTGGANLRIVLAEPMTDAAVKDALRADAKFAQQYPNVQVNRYGEARADGTGNEFNLRLKLTDQQRAQIEADRKLHRQQRDAAKDAGQAPPVVYEPPYVTELRRLFAGKLVKPAFGTPVTAPIPSQDNLQFALLEVYLQQPVDLAKTREALAKGLGGSSIMALGDPAATTAKDLRIEWRTQASTRPWEIPAIVKDELDKAKLTDTRGEPITLSDPFPDAQEIQGRLVSDLRNAAIGALILAWALIVLYLRVRFHEYKYGIGAVVALIHDVLVALVAVVFFNAIGWVHAELNLAMIACFLTIIGYSVNDTIVIFDRIRENAHENARLGVTEPFKTLINRALNQTMSRTLLTSGLTLLVVIAQFAVNWGSESDLESFAFAMIIGMISGVYSTIYIAAPILIWLDKGDLSKPQVKVEATDPAATPAS
ncbi:MAG: protein translocase subunit SecD [Planctomycetota bacterium]